MARLPDAGCCPAAQRVVWCVIRLVALPMYHCSKLVVPSRLASPWYLEAVASNNMFHCYLDSGLKLVLVLAFDTS